MNLPQKTRTFDLKRWLARINGYDLLGRDQHPSLESHLDILFRRLGIDVVLDVGANRGQYGAMLRREGYRGAIHSFEPVSAVHEALLQTIGDDPDWKAHRMALGAAPGLLQINVTRQSEFSSFLKPSGFADQAYARESAIAAREEVQVETLDRFFASHAGDLAGRRILLKMDTQGFDQQVLAGAEHSLGQVAALQSELSLIPIYDGMPDYLESLRNFEAAGFKISGFYPICRKGDLAIIEMDCIAVRHSVIDEPG